MSPSELDRHYRRYLAAVTLFHHTAAEACGLPPTDYHASSLLSLTGPMSSGELAAQLALSPSATTRLVDRLVAAGLATRVHDEADRRRVLIAHTGKLPDGLAPILEAVRGPIADLIETLSPEQQAGLQAYVEGATRAYADATRRTGLDRLR